MQVDLNRRADEGMNFRGLDEVMHLIPLQFIPGVNEITTLAKSHLWKQELIKEGGYDASYRVFNNLKSKKALLIAHKIIQFNTSSHAMLVAYGIYTIGLLAVFKQSAIAPIAGTFILHGLVYLYNSNTLFYYAHEYIFQKEQQDGAEKRQQEYKEYFKRNM